jgi:hypothetical protein
MPGSAENGFAAIAIIAGEFQASCGQVSNKKGGFPLKPAPCAVSL